MVFARTCKSMWFFCLPWRKQGGIHNENYSALILQRSIILASFYHIAVEILNLCHHLYASTQSSWVLHTAEMLIQSNEARQRSGSAEIKGDTTNSAGRHQMRVLALTFSMTMRTEQLTRATVLENKWKVSAERSGHMFLWCRIKSVYRKGWACRAAIRGIQNGHSLREITYRLHSSLGAGKTNQHVTHGKCMEHVSSNRIAEYMSCRNHYEALTRLLQTCAMIIKQLWKTNDFSWF